MKKIFFLFYLSLALISFSLPLYYFSGSSGSDTISYIINQNFENTGYDNDEVWITSTGTPNPDYTDVVLLGDQSLRTNESNTNVRIRRDFDGNDTLYGYLLFRRVGGSASLGDRTLLEITINGGTTRAIALQFTASGALKIIDLSGSNTDVTNQVMSLDQTYHIWWSYIKTGSTAVASIGFSTNSTKPSGGNDYFANISIGSGAIQGGRIWLGHAGTNTNSSLIYDKVIIDDEEIGDNP